VRPVAQYGATSAERERLLSRTNHSQRNRLHAVPEISRARRFDDQVQVIALNGPVGDPEASSLAALLHRRFECTDEASRSERRQSGAHFQGDVARRRPSEARATPMRIAANRCPPSPRTFTPAAPSRKAPKTEVELCVACHREMMNASDVRCGHDARFTS
jgi:hypothetical protein